MTRTEKAGLSFAAVEILVVGLVPAFSKYAVSRVDPLLYSAAAVTIAAAVALLFAAGRGEAARVFSPSLAVWLIPTALLGTTATTLLLFFGSRMTDGVSAALLLQCEPVYSLLLVWLVWRRAASRRQLVGTALIMLGLVLVLYNGSVHVGLGGFLILLTPLAWQISHVLALKVMPRIGPYALTASRYVYGGAALVVVQLVFGTTSVSALGGRGFVMAGFHGAVLFFLGTLLWYEVIKRLDLARATAIITPAEPIASLLLVWLLLGSTPNLLQWIGLLLVAPGMWFVVTRSGFDESKPHVTDAIGSSAVPIEASMPAGKDTDSGR